VGLFLPQRWKRQPQGPQRIDWGNPLAAGLEHAVINNGTKIDSVTGNRPTSGSNGSFGSDLGIRAINNGADTYETRTKSGTSQGLGQTSTVFLLCARLGTASTSTPAYNQSGVINFITIGTDGNFSATYVDSTFVSNVAGAGLENAIPLGVVTGVTARFNPSVGVDLFKGKQNVKSNAAYSPLVWNFKTIGSSGNSSVANALTLVWGRALEDAEIAALNDNPWQLFAPQRAAFFSLPAASGPVLSLPTVIDITSTSVRPRVTITI